MVRVWIFHSGTTEDMLVEVFGDAGPIPDDDDLLYSETVSDGDYTWTATGDYLYGYAVYEVEIPIGGFDISPGTMYWLSLQHQGGGSNFWCATYPQPEWWDEWALYFQGAWMAGGFCSYRDQFFELHGSIVPPDEEDPTVTDMYPQDADYPSGVPPSENTSGCHWQDGDPETNEGIDVDASYFEVYDADMDLVTGMLDIDDSDLWDVVVDFEGDDPWEEGATYTVETETYDLAGNSANETWDFITGYVNVAPASLGVIKVGFIE
jgi:hypothetical protein